jgi:hypothetical protein
MSLSDVGVFESCYLDCFIDAVLGFMVEETAIACCFRMTALISCQRKCNLVLLGQ